MGQVGQEKSYIESSGNSKSQESWRLPRFEDAKREKRGSAGDGRPIYREEPVPLSHLGVKILKTREKRWDRCLKLGWDRFGTCPTFLEISGNLEFSTRSGNSGNLEQAEKWPPS
jgi:hypothetical protein